MRNKEAHKKKSETDRGEHDDEPTEQSASDEDREHEKKKPEPADNLRRRSEWFQKRH